LEISSILAISRIALPKSLWMFAVMLTTRAML
jgi:hypothetical protein